MLCSFFSIYQLLLFSTYCSLGWTMKPKFLVLCSDVWWQLTFYDLKWMRHLPKHFMFYFAATAEAVQGRQCCGWIWFWDPGIGSVHWEDHGQHQVDCREQAKCLGLARGWNKIYLALILYYMYVHFKIYFYLNLFSNNLFVLKTNFPPNMLSESL